MVQYILRRLLITVPVLFGITVLVFLFIALAPGDPCVVGLHQARAGRQPALRAAMRKELARSAAADPLHPLAGPGRAGQPGLPRSGRPPGERGGWQRAEELGGTDGHGAGDRLPGRHPVRSSQRCASIRGSISHHGAGVPGHLIAVVPVWAGWAVRLRPQAGLFPIGGMVTPSQPFAIGDFLHHLALPALILSFAYVAILMRYTRSSMLEVINATYVTTARAKGLREWDVVLVHAFRNALIPIITVIGLALPEMVGGAVITETVFSWPGMGSLLVEGVAGRDYPLIMGISLLVGTGSVAGQPAHRYYLCVCRPTGSAISDRVYASRRVTPV
ncbi:MAG: ABC transporter permease [Kouleothrix sp.]